jgi:hypothetical protein
MQKTIADTEPDFTGFSRAWRVKYTSPKWAEGKDGTVGIWIINAPWAHPVWPNYMLLCVHLRPMPNQDKPAIIYKPGATHELTLWALDPKEPVPVEAYDGAELYPKRLTPCNFLGQFTAESDEAARQLLEDKVVKPICAGTLNPDTDATPQWVALFGDDCFKAEYRNAKPGSIEHAIMQGQTVVIVGGTREEGEK